MADASTPAPGLGFEDFRNQVTPVMLRKNGNGTPSTDALREGLEMRRQMAGLKMIERSVAEEDIAATQARNEKLKLEIEARQLEAQRTGGAAQGTTTDKWLEVAFAEVKEAREQLSRAQSEMAAQQVALLQERIGMLTEEFQRVQQQAANVPPPPDPLEQTMTILEQHRRLGELISPPPAEKPPAGSSDVVVAAYLERLRMDQTRWEKQEGNRSAAQLRQIELEAQLQERRLELDRENQQRMTRFMDETLPNISKMFEPLIQQWANRMAQDLTHGGTPGVTGVGASPMGAAGFSARPQVAAPAPLPAGVVEMACQACGGTIAYREEWPGVICPFCHAEYRATPPAATAESPTRPVSESPDTWVGGRAETDQGGGPWE